MEAAGLATNVSNTYYFLVGYCHWYLMRLVFNATGCTGIENETSCAQNQAAWDLAQL